VSALTQRPSLRALGRNHEDVKGFHLPQLFAADPGVGLDVQGPVGDWAARDVAKSQPTKLAAIEGLPRTTRGGPEHLLGWYHNGQVKYGIEIPHLLSLLAFHSWNAPMQGRRGSFGRRARRLALGGRVDRGLGGH
jgi:hypothetical protein